MRECNRCRYVKPYTPEYWVWSKKSNCSNYRHCRKCFNKEAREKACPVKRKKKHLRLKYNISLEEYNKYMSKPCSICGSKSQHLDHDHITGELLEALCSNCNRGIGHLKEDIEILENAIKYIKKHNKKSKR